MAMAHLGNSDWQIGEAAQSPYLSRDLESEVESVCEFFEECPREAFTTIPDVLGGNGLDLIDKIDVPKNGKYKNKKMLAHPVGSVLVSLMGGISLSKSDCDLQPERVVASLRNETGRDVVIPPHRDLLDGHAVLFNWGVKGNLRYFIDGNELKIRDNMIVVLNGSANWQEVTAAVHKKKPEGVWKFGGTTALHAVVGRGRTVRNRLLVYADGVDTNFTQIFEDEYGPVPEMADSLLFMGLRPSLGIYVE